MASTNETETFQHYQVLRRADGTLHELGRGAMGVTYKAFDTNLRSYVALKVINALHLDSETARARFLREARAAAALRHRNIASVYHLGNDDQSFFYAMEFVDGQTLETLVKDNGASLPANDALQIALQASRALGAAGKQGLVHRDIKPANIMVQREDDEDDGFVVKVIDFGLARSQTGGEGSAHITIGGFVGTPQYASPEQLEEKDLDIRSDIYSLGITLWYMLVGRPPFVGPLGSVFIQQMTKEPPWDQVAGQPEPVKALLARLLQKDPDNRPQSPAELRREIEACLRKLPAATTRNAVLLPPPSQETMASGTSGGSRTAAGPPGPPPTVSPPTAATDAIAPPGVPVPVGGEATGRPAVIATGTLLIGRYDLGDFVGQGNNGRVFHARDLAREQRPVAVKVLHADVLGSEGEQTRLQDTLARLRQAPHPHLMECKSLEQTPGCRFLVQEWIGGFTLVDLLRSRGQLPVRETLQLLAQAAAAADHAFGNDLSRVELGLHQILVHFPSVVAGSQAGRALLGTPVDKWPGDFSLKLDALGITREAGDSVTWGGDMTMMPSAPVLGRDTQTSIRGLVESTQFFALGLLTYELLNGAPPVQGRGQDGRGIKYAALPSLNEEANDVLRQMLTPNPGYTSGQEFFHALCKASGVVIPLASSTTITPVAARPGPVDARSRGETLVFDAPAEADSAAEVHGETMVFDERAVEEPPAFEEAASRLDTLVTARGAGSPAPSVEEEAARRATEERMAEEARLAEAERIAEAERAAETARIAEEERVAEAQRVAEAERAAELERIAKAERAAEARRIAEAEKAAETLRIAEAKRIADEQRIAEAKRVAEEQRVAEAARIAEVQRLAEAKRLADAERRAEEKRIAEAKAAQVAEAKRLAEIERVAEAARVAEARQLAEAERVAEAARVAEAKRLADAERIAEAERMAELKRLAEAERAAEVARVAEAKRAAKVQKFAEAERAAEAKRLAKAEQVAEANRIKEEQRLAKARAAEEAKALEEAVPVAKLIVPSNLLRNDASEIPPPRSWRPLLIGGIAAMALIGGVCAIILPRGSHQVPVVVQHPETMFTPATTPATSPVIATTLPDQTPVAVSSPAVTNPVVDAATPEPMPSAAAPAGTPEPTLAAAIAADSAPPPVRTSVSTPPPDVKSTHARDVAASHERVEAEKRDAERAEAEKRDAEKKEAREITHEDTKPKPTPKPRVVAVKPPPPPPKKEASKPAATPDPNANRGGPGIGFMR